MGVKVIMNQNGVIYFDPENDMHEINFSCEGNAAASLFEQESYAERHADDFEGKSLLGRIWDTCSLAVYATLAFLFVFRFILLVGVIPSASMEPTLMTGENLIVNRLSYVTEEPARGDIVVFDSEEYDELIVKRVIGVPGDVIDIIDGNVYVNGCRLVEDYVAGTTTPSVNQVTHFEVPEDSVFLLGDNREVSADSRWWNDPYISYDEILGKAWVNYSINVDLGYYAGLVENAPATMVNDSF